MVDVFENAHHFVAIKRLQIVRRIKVRHLADIPEQGVGLSDVGTVHAEHRQCIEWRAVSHLAELLERQAFIFKFDVRRVQRNPDRLAATTVEIKIGQFIIGHFVISST